MSIYVRGKRGHKWWDKEFVELNPKSRIDMAKAVGDAFCNDQYESLLPKNKNAIIVYKLVKVGRISMDCKFEKD